MISVYTKLLTVSLKNIGGILKIKFKKIKAFPNKSFYNIFQILKWFKNNFIQVSLVILLSLSIFLPYIIYYISVNYKQFKFMGTNIDVLGYYGSVLGGMVTIIGIVLTFNYERKKSSEELRKNNLPLLRFSYKPDKFKSDPNKKYDVAVISGLTKEINDYNDSKKNLKQAFFLQQRLFNQQEHSNKQIEYYYSRLKIVANTYKNNSEEYLKESNYFQKAQEIIYNESRRISKDIVNLANSISQGPKKINIVNEGVLDIENIGLQTAIITSITLKKHDGTLSLDTEIFKVGRFAVPKNQKIQLTLLIDVYDYHELDYLLIEFIDLYHNKYEYLIPFELQEIEGKNSLIINPNNIPVLPKQLSN